MFLYRRIRKFNIELLLLDTNLTVENSCVLRKILVIRRKKRFDIRVLANIPMGESNTIVSAYTQYWHLQ